MSVKFVPNATYLSGNSRRAASYQDPRGHQPAGGQQCTDGLRLYIENISAPHLLLVVHASNITLSESGWSQRHEYLPSHCQHLFCSSTPHTRS